MNHSLRPPENNYLMLVLTKQTIQSIVITNVIPSITVVSESNNIIFTLKKIYQTTNLMKHVFSRTRCKGTAFFTLSQYIRPTFYSFRQYF